MPKKNSKKVNLRAAIFVAVSLLITTTFSSYYTGSGPEVDSDNTLFMLGELTSIPDSLLAQAEARQAKQEKEPEPQEEQEEQKEQEEVQEQIAKAEPKQQNPSPQNKTETNERPGEAAGQSAPKTELQPVAQPNPEPVAEPKQQTEPKADPAPEPDPAPQKQPQPSPSGLSQAENEMLALVNGERQSKGLQPLKATGELTEVARTHSRDMVDNNFFSHSSPTYGSLSERLKMFNISYTAAGENIAGAGTVGSAHNNLMNSPGHRANILNGNYTHVGIGIVRCDRYGLMITQIFIRH